MIVLAAILAAYVIGWALTTRILARRFIDDRARCELDSRTCSAQAFSKPEWRADWLAQQGPLMDEDTRRDATCLAALLALIWPGYWPLQVIVLLWDLAVAGLGRGLISHTEIVEAERRELDALRKQAREYGLPMPDDTQKGDR